MKGFSKFVEFHCLAQDVVGNLIHRRSNGRDVHSSFAKPMIDRIDVGFGEAQHVDVIHVSEVDALNAQLGHRGDLVIKGRGDFVGKTGKCPSHPSYVTRPRDALIPERFEVV